MSRQTTGRASLLSHSCVDSIPQPEPHPPHVLGSGVLGFSGLGVYLVVGVCLGRSVGGVGAAASLCSHGAPHSRSSMLAVSGRTTHDAAVSARARLCRTLNLCCNACWLSGIPTVQNRHPQCTQTTAHTEPLPVHTFPAAHPNCSANHPLLRTPPFREPPPSANPTPPPLLITAVPEFDTLLPNRKEPH